MEVVEKIVEDDPFEIVTLSAAKIKKKKTGKGPWPGGRGLINYPKWIGFCQSWPST